MEMTYKAIARTIDHALLGPSMTESELRSGCLMSAEYQVASVCIKPYAVPLALAILRGAGVAVGTVIGFPHGGNSTTTKVFETRQAIEQGASEVDMVINIGQALEGEWSFVLDDIASVTSAAHDLGAIVKVIFETAYLDDAQKTRLCTICGEVGADYVKTSTGYASSGANRHDLILMRRESPGHVKVKASGGIRDLETAIEFLELGAERLGLSKTPEILDAWRLRLGLPAIASQSLVVPRGTGPSGKDAY